jgi:ribosomal protein S21
MEMDTKMWDNNGHNSTLKIFKKTNANNKILRNIAMRKRF